MGLVSTWMGDRLGTPDAVGFLHRDARSFQHHFLFNFVVKILDAATIKLLIITFARAYSHSTHGKRWQQKNDHEELCRRMWQGLKGKYIYIYTEEKREKKKKKYIYIYIIQVIETNAHTLKKMMINQSR